MAEKYKESKEFGERLVGLIEKKGLNVNRLAKKLKKFPSVINSYTKGRIPTAPILYELSKEFGISMEELLVGKTQESSEVINFNRRREDIFFQKDPDLKFKLDLFIKFWQTGNPYIRDLFETGLKTAQGLIEKDLPPNPKKKQATPGKS